MLRPSTGLTSGKAPATVRTGCRRLGAVGVKRRAANESVGGEGQELVDRADAGRALADSRRHPLGGAGAHVADGEQARVARLERQRQPAQGGPALVGGGGTEGGG